MVVTFENPEAFLGISHGSDLKIPWTKLGMEGQWKSLAQAKEGFSK
jgi:hypothetical protein